MRCADQLQVGSLLALLVGAWSASCGRAGECNYNGTAHASGTSFVSSDGCNTCTCQSGQVSCTLRDCGARWFNTCGDPVCEPSGHRTDPSIPACTTERLGDACSQVGARCDPNDPCNVRLVCATSDPTMQPGGCPISVAAAKREIHYLDEGELERCRDELLAIELASYVYAADAARRPQLGFIVDDVQSPIPVNSDGRTVNVYGYVSMAVAALKVQAREIERLEARIEALERRLEAKDR
jgi:hypothetical protein